MNNLIGTAIIALGAAAGTTGAVQASAAMPAVADALKIAARTEPVFEARIAGVQIYLCTRKSAPAGATYEWQFKSPEGTMIGADGEILGTHSAGPSWEMPDGSKVMGEVLARAPAPAAADIPWLLLKARSVGGPGKLGDVAYIHRLQTEGGVAPAAGCKDGNEGQEARVPYSARYYFYKEVSPYSY